MTRWATLGVVLVVALAGCSALSFGEPTPQEEPAPVKLVNNASLTETFTVAVVDLGTNLTVTREDSDIFNKTVGEGSSTLKTTSNNKFVKVELPVSTRIHGNHTLKPGESKLLSVEKVAPNQAIVVLVYDEPEGTYRAIKSLNCGGLSIAGYRVASRSGGSEDWTTTTHQCV